MSAWFPTHSLCMWYPTHSLSVWETQREGRGNVHQVSALINCESLVAVSWCVVSLFEWADLCPRRPWRCERNPRPKAMDKGGRIELSGHSILVRDGYLW